MILVDTNVVLEPLKPMPSTQVLDWLDAQSIETLFISAISIAELRNGVASMSAGRRRDVLQARIEKDVLALFADRILPLDFDATESFARCMAEAKRAGTPVSMADGFIGAIAKSRDLMVATRDVAPFVSMGVAVINPWTS